ncbi:hypothetical protein B0T18DRAFT_414312 [Schizothecium vesticola]|uniref:Secreted protein n=1 Tax=Schizothecium vesticola TaxID=314040 RepID=A0AA40EPG0_9PEZI|nr:hypothetical protein B0T18DRAFT_414312 [Schizothecium vesticola]
MLFCLRLHLLAFFFSALRLELYEVHKKERLVAGERSAASGLWQEGHAGSLANGSVLWLWLDEAGWGWRTVGWRFGCGGGGMGMVMDHPTRFAWLGFGLSMSLMKPANCLGL